jgi:ABC-2 type transport system permease protein
MILFIKVVSAEAIKQFKNKLHSVWVFFSMLLWPVLAFATTYYQFKPFSFDAVRQRMGYLSDESLITYIMIGYFAMVFFRSFVQSAWEFSSERMYGTLELIYLSPANRVAVMLGNALASLVTNVWMFAVFMVGIFGLFNKIPVINLTLLILALALMVLMSILWGMLLNALFLFTRDSGMLFTLLEEPMELFSGVKIPVSIFPVWAKAIGALFPLTYAIALLRGIVLEGHGLLEVSNLLYTCLFICITMGVATLYILKVGEKHNAKTGDMALF